MNAIVGGGGVKLGFGTGVYQDVVMLVRVVTSVPLIQEVNMDEVRFYQL